MKWIYLLFSLMSFNASAIVFDCREFADPTQGYFILIEDQKSKIQEVYQGDLIGPVYTGTVYPPNEQFLFIVSTEVSQNYKSGRFEIWIPHPHEQNPFFSAYIYFYGPAFNTSWIEFQFPANLTCSVQSEAVPSLFRSEI